MSYLDNITELKYTSVSGVEFTLQYDDVEQSLSKKYSLQEYPQTNNADLQDLGNASRRFPVRCYVTGENYDKQADRFISALNEKGAGTLNHPRFGRAVQVLPVTINHKENFVEGMGRANFEIEFVEYIPPEKQFTKVSGADISAAAASLATSSADSVKNVKLSVANIKLLGSRISNQVQSVTNFANSITDSVDDVVSTIEKTANSIVNSIDALLRSPADLANSMLELYRLPLQLSASVAAKVNGYKVLVENLKDGFTNTSADYGLIDSNNAIIALSATAEASVDSEYRTRETAIEAVENLNNLQFDFFQALDEYENLAGFISDQNTINDAQAMLSSAIMQIIEESADLPTERKFILDKDATPLDVVFSIDGNIDRIDEFIEYNNLVMEERLIIPKGKEIKFYV